MSIGTKKIQVLHEELEKGIHEARLREVYVNESILPHQTKRYQQALKKFEALFGEHEVAVFSAPGRTEIGGNHTDHQHGNVLAAAVNMDAIAIVAKQDEALVELVSEGYRPIKVRLVELDQNPAECGTTISLIRGVLRGMCDAGYQIGGFKAYITSDVLGGSGLSSSAAFEVLIGTIISGLYNEQKISPVEIAKMAQYAEREYFGKPCGLMDQMASAVGALIHIDFADPELPDIERIDVDFTSFGHSLCIVDTKGSHADLTDEYAAVPAEMKVVAGYLGKDVLEEVDEREFFKAIPEIRKMVGDRALLRAIHFFADNDRVLAETAALKEGRFEEFLRLVNESGDSSFKYLQNVYTNKDVRNQAMSLGLAVSEALLLQKGACRVHGGGFAGTIQAFVPNEMVDTYQATLENIFGPGTCNILSIRMHGGIRVI